MYTMYMSKSTKNHVKTTLHTLAISSLESNPFQPRNKILNEDIRELADSIQEHGVIEPLIVAETPAGYQIIAGERRWRAAKLAGLKEVPCAVMKTTPKRMLELALVENVQREDLNAIERAKGFQRLHMEFGYNYEEIAQKVSKSKSYVNNSIGLLSLPDLVTDAVIDGQITEGHARAIIGVPSEERQIRCFRKIIEENASVRGAEEIARREKRRRSNISPQVKAKVFDNKDELIERINKSLKMELSSPVDIQLSRSRIQTRVTITLKGSIYPTERDLLTLLDKLQNE